MNEHLRMQYLETLGIESFVPRVLLSQTPSPFLCELPEPLASEIVESTENAQEQFKTAKSSEASAKLVSSVLAEIKGKQERPHDKPSTKAQEPLEALEPEKTEEAASFLLNIWRPDSSLLVIDSRRPQAALPTERLLMNILYHSVWRVKSLPTSDQQVWPLVNNVGSAGWHAAKEMMGAFLDGRLVSQPTDYFMVFGEDAYRATNGESVENELPFSEVCFTKIRLAAYAVEALVFPSLAEILESPEEKIKIWRLLTSLKQ